MSAVAGEILLSLKQSWPHDEHDFRMQEILDYIRSNLREAIDRNSIARRFSITPKHVNFLFRKHLNATPSTIINRERVRRAHELLSSEDISVAEAAQAVGFNDPFYFSRRFRKVFGHAPSQVIRLRT